MSQLAASVPGNILSMFTPEGRKHTLNYSCCFFSTFKVGAEFVGNIAHILKKHSGLLLTVFSF